MLMSAPLDRSSFTWSTCLYSVAQIMAVQPPSSWGEKKPHIMKNIIKRTTHITLNRRRQPFSNPTWQLYAKMKQHHSPLGANVHPRTACRYITAVLMATFLQQGQTFQTKTHQTQCRPLSPSLQVPQLSISNLPASKCVWRTHPNDTQRLHLNTYCTI